MPTSHLLAAGALLGSLALAPAAARLRRPSSGVAQAQPTRPFATTATPPSYSLKIVLFGTGVGPVVNLQQYEASTLIEAGGMRFVFDCGRGATM